MRVRDPAQRVDAHPVRRLRCYVTRLAEHLPFRTRDTDLLAVERRISTIAAGIYPNDAKHLRLWIKNARMMKPGSAMPTLGLGQRDPITGATVSQSLGGLNDQQIADIVAYLQSLR